MMILFFFFTKAWQFYIYDEEENMDLKWILVMNINGICCYKINLKFAIKCFDFLVYFKEMNWIKVRNKS